MSQLEFNELVAGSTQYLVPFAIGFTRDQDAAKDLLQETLCKALYNREKYHAGTNFRAWLYTIMRHIFINNYRRKTKEKEILSHSVQESSQHAQIPSSADSTLHLHEIQKIVRRLPRIFQTPFLLYFEGYRYHEIALALNEPLGTIKSRIHFARKLLKEQISLN